jgi:hypothetical protein
MTTAHRPTWAPAKVRTYIVIHCIARGAARQLEWRENQVAFTGHADPTVLPYTHRPQGGEEQGGMRFYAPSQARSKKDVSGFTKMKYRQDGQASKRDLAGKDARADIEERELEYVFDLDRRALAPRAP